MQSATRWAAELMGWEDRVGSLAAGTFADIIGVKGDPLDDVSLLEDIRLVLKGGDWVVGAAEQVSPAQRS